MFYRIADIIIHSTFRMPSFAAFSCEPAKADVILTEGGMLPSPGMEFCAGALRVNRLPEGWFFKTADREGAGLIASEDYTRLCLAGDDSALRGLGIRIEWLVKAALECLLIRRGYVSLHAAALAVDGSAYAFTGPSGTGKSTRADAWREAFDAQMISGDRPLIKVDSMELCGVPWDGKERCYRNVRYPLKMICEVRRSGAVYARAMSFDQRRCLLMQHSLLTMWDTETSTLQMMNLVKLARSALIVRMFGGPLPEDARAMRKILERREWKKEEKDMKARSGFELKHVVGEYMLMPTGDNIGKFNGTVVLNEVSAFIWKKLQNPVSRDDLLTAILDKYNVEEANAAKDLDALLEKLKGFGVVEEG